MRAAASRGGYSFFIQSGRLIFEYNHQPGRTRIVSEADVPPGRASVSVRFEKTGDLTGEASLHVDGALVGGGPIAGTFAGLVAIEGLDIGQDSKTAVSDLYRAPFPFGGTIHHVDFELGDDQSDPDQAR